MSISEVILQAFKNDYPSSVRDNAGPNVLTNGFINISLSNRIDYEIPANLLTTVLSPYCHNYDNIILTIPGKVDSGSYKSAVPVINELLNSRCRLVKPQQENAGNYFGFDSMILDSNYNINCIFTYQLREACEKYLYIKPIMRIIPQCLQRTDLISKTIFKMLKEVCTPQLQAVLVRNVKYTIGRENLVVMRPAVIIDDIPFKVERPSAPSINTSKESLINIVLDNLEDFDNIAP